MRAGISRVVVEIIILVIAVALALLIFSPISGYIFGSLGRTSTVGGAAQIQVLNAQFTAATGGGYDLRLDVKNLGPGTIPPGTWHVFVNNTDWGTYNMTDPLAPGGVESVTVHTTGTIDTTRQHNIVVYGPGNTQAQYLYYPPS
ncbi:hypothetical protein [Candidatus Methanodesulfokora washburnensis]|uniref:Type IV pilin n=1 Tax=Candidatus Methanodesulfokora washburnensis TaxID=2478471 RepID=A0A3R9R0V0_9CREN|nr:hypothetical protein [Candidatus Methanodesulfokores washburnensis]RSN76666.1 hypothetical protein D6D85_03825 [Candidatus Methanodesulfokores washburnensis]